MPFDEWGQLEVINAHLEDLWHRRLAAERMGKIERARELGEQIIEAERQRNRLVEQIVGRVHPT